MENIIYEKFDTDSVLAKERNKIKFYCMQTNECEPYRQIQELGVVIVGSNTDLQIDFSLDPNELKSLIKYLTDLSEHVDEFNKNSKPKPELI